MNDLLPEKASPDNNLFKPYELVCEYAENPIGVDAAKPRLSWKLGHYGRGQHQTAYQILAAGSREKLENDSADLWDSGKVGSGDSINIVYNGKILSSEEACFWKVRVWDANGSVSIYSEIAVFEMGLLESNDWKGGWMGFPAGRNGYALYFRNGFKIEKSVQKGIIHISGLGYYELRMNGEKVGDHVLDPGWTEYGKRILYSTFDISEYLKIGTNAIGVIVGNGWHGMPCLMLQMNIHYCDGTADSVISDPDTGWIVSAGAIARNSIYDGETYDARLERPGWDTPEYDAREDMMKGFNGWIRPVRMESPGGKLVSQLMEPIKVVNYLRPVNIKKIRPGVYVFDMGQNMAGWVRLVVKGEKGTVMTLKFSEVLYHDGTVNQENLRTAEATDIYILKGEGTETFEPHFTYHGFRYVQVDGFPYRPETGSITGCVVRSSVEAAGTFECSNELLNKIHRNVQWTESGNLHSIPTDCPQRDERMGWLNDMTVRAEEGIYNFNMSGFYAKWLEDISDAQDKLTGAITDTAPFRWGGRPADPVSSCFLIVPWLLYLHYGDKGVLEKHYEGMKKWVGFLSARSVDHIISYSYYGDWASPVKESLLGEGSDCPVSANTPGELMSTGFYYYNTLLMSRIAGVLEKYEDRSEFIRLSEDIKNAFNQKFFNISANSYAKGSQAGNTFPLFLRLVPEKYEQPVLENLVKDIVYEHEGHLTTGNICTKYIMETLTEFGYADVAYLLATQTTYPSWGYMISKGATTIWERWEYAEGKTMNSHNHPMLASIGSWFYKSLGGINADPEGPGFGNIIIKPYIVGDLTYVNTTYKSIRGIVKTGLKINGNSFTLNITIPVNSKCKIYMPILGKSRDMVIKEGGNIIFRNNSFIGAIPGIYDIIQQEGCIVIKAGSGTYIFESLY